jgi:hypothetical protein
MIPARFEKITKFLHLRGCFRSKQTVNCFTNYKTLPLNLCFICCILDSQLSPEQLLFIYIVRNYYNIVYGIMLFLFLLSL